MNIIFASVKKTIINHYQSETGIDQDKVQEIKASVQQYRDNGQKGLLELPTARLNADGCYEFAFGRHRRQAFIELAAEDAFWSEIPLNVQDLTDQEMLELMGIEQMHRRDVGILEIAETFHRYMTDFNKTSVDMALKFGKSEEYVRSAIRMLNLPEKAKDRMQEGKLNVTGARAVLTLTRVLPNDESALQDALESIEAGEPAEEAIADALRDSGKVRFIHSSSFSTSEKTFKYLPPLAVKDVEPLYREIYGDYDAERQQQALNEYQRMSAKKPEPVGPSEERMLHLLKPPACTACPFYAKVDGTEFCGWELCFTRKEQGKQEARLHEVSEKLGITIYQPEDGKSTMLNQYNDKHRVAFNKKHADLRLVRGGSYVNHFSELNGTGIAVVAIGKLHEAWKKADEKTKAEIEAHHDTGSKAPAVDYERQRAVREIIDAQIGIFAWETVVPILAGLLEGIVQQDFLERLQDIISEGSGASMFDKPESAYLKEKQIADLKKPARLAYRRKQIISDLLDILIDGGELDKIYNTRTPVALYGNWVKSLATTWGVKLPKDFDKAATAAEEAIKLAIAEFDKNRKGAK